MAFLRAFIDDSAAQTGDKRLFLAGYLHRTDVWATFSEVWDAELGAWPKIDYFKAVEANNLRDQFDRKHGWTRDKADAKLAQFAHIISAFKPVSFQFSINRRLVETTLRPASPRGIGNAHFNVIFYVVAGLTQFAAQIGITEPIEFIFDQQDGVDDDVALFISSLKKALPSEARDLIEGPYFKNDKDHQFKPLQAADMLAWHIRRQHVSKTKLPILDKLLNPDGHIVGDIPDDAVLRWADHHSKLPNVQFLQSKEQWRNVKEEIRRLIANGIDPSTIKPPNT